MARVCVTPRYLAFLSESREVVLYRCLSNSQRYRWALAGLPRDGLGGVLRELSQQSLRHSSLIAQTPACPLQARQPCKKSQEKQRVGGHGYTSRRRWIFSFVHGMSFWHTPCQPRFTPLVAHCHFCSTLPSLSHSTSMFISVNVNINVNNTTIGVAVSSISTSVILIGIIEDRFGRGWFCDPVRSHPGAWSTAGVDLIIQKSHFTVRLASRF